MATDGYAGNGLGWSTEPAEHFHLRVRKREAERKAPIWEAAASTIARRAFVEVIERTGDMQMARGLGLEREMLPVKLLRR
jgi:hypothetical protein